MPNEAPPEAAELIAQLTAHAPGERPSARQVVERLEELTPGFSKQPSLPLSAGSLSSASGVAAQHQLARPSSLWRRASRQPPAQRPAALRKHLMS